MGWYNTKKSEPNLTHNEHNWFSYKPMISDMKCVLHSSNNKVTLITMECLALPARWVRGTNSGASTFNVVSIGHFSGKYFVRIIIWSSEISTPELSSTA